MSLGALLPLVLALLAQAAYTLVSERDAMDTGLEHKARALAALMVDVTGPSLAFDDRKAVADELGYVASDPDFGFAAAIAADGALVGFRGKEIEPASVAGQTVRAVRPAVLQHDHLVIAVVPVVTDGHQIGTVFVGLRDDKVHAQVTSMLVRAAAISVLGIAIAVLVVLFLAGKISRRNAQMRLVLDNVDEALATIRRDGTLEPECSAAFVRWFGAPAGGSFAARVAGTDETMRALLVLGWTELVAGVMPLEVLIDQFPSRLTRGDQHFRLDVKPLFERDVLVGALLRILDITAEVTSQQTLAAQREYVAMFERALADPRGVRDFIEDTGRLVASLPEDHHDQAERMRVAHTIKGNAAVYGVDSVAEAAHRLEDAIADSNSLDPLAVQELLDVWTVFAKRVEKLLGDRREKIELTRAEVESLAIIAERGGEVAADRLRSLLLEPVEPRFDTYRQQIERVAERIGKPIPIVKIEANGVRLAPDRLRPFWGSFAHLVRNSLDHGIEPAEDRALAGKPAEGTIELVAHTLARSITISIADDGRGVDWDRVREIARAAGLPHATRADLEGALFADGVSTADQVSETSGRGVGLAAVRAAVHAADGTIAVTSEPGRGTRFTFTFPVGSHQRTQSMSVIGPHEPLTVRGIGYR